MLQTWFKIFFRNQQKNWLNIVINVSGLTLGLAGLLIILLYLKDEEIYNASNPYKNQVYKVLHKMGENEIWDSSTNIEGSYYKAEIPEIQECYLSQSSYESIVVEIGKKKIYTQKILKGQATFFDVFPFEIIAGSTSKFKEARNHVALSDKQAELFFGKRKAIGKTIDFFGRTFMVTTVYKIEGKHYFMPNIVLQFKEKPREDWGSFSNTLFVKTSLNVNKIELDKKALAIWHKNSVLPGAKAEGITPELFFEKYGTTTYFEPLNDIRLKSISKNTTHEGKGNYQLIKILLALSVLLIIISCVNFINLTTASATQRAKEVGVKKTLGLSKRVMIFQYALEVILQGFIALLFSLLLVELVLPSFNDFMNKDISILEIDVLVKISIIALIVSFCIASIPSLYLSSFKAVEVLKGNISKSKNKVFARNIMLGFQFLISGFFLIGSLVINKQVNYMTHKDLGFNGEQIIMIPMTGTINKYKKYQLAKKELIKHPNIETLTSNNFVIGGGSANSTNFAHKEINVQSFINCMDYNYLNTMDIEIIKGRDLQEEIASDSITNVLINESLAKKMNIYENPIGKKISSGFRQSGKEDKQLEVVGMVKDYHIEGLDTQIGPTVFTHWNTYSSMKRNFWIMQLKIKPDNVKETLSFIENYWRKNIEQGYPFNPTFLNKRFARTHKKYEKQETLFFIITSIIILIALLGLFALATLTIQQRLKEVAIRKTLGASVKEIMFQLIKSFLKITVVASVFLVPFAYYFMQNWLDNFVYKIEMPLLPYLITPVILVILVFVVVGLKAYNATKVDLIKYLKFE